MFLLIPYYRRFRRKYLLYFTFHNVSINTLLKLFLNILQIALHSIMFLLIPFDFSSSGFMPNYFTFHNVSINTSLLPSPSNLVLYFTFHNVSINTTPDDFVGNTFYTLHSIMFLLIPVSSIIS